jgi:LytS/YehU family sensor histidine kinase
MKAHAKKQLQMELELKAIYAQINPHFIFNALTSAMLLIKKNRMDEAYTHVAKFSRLLRSYLNSSRNKYISIADEVANLTNYMELQQARFKERFESIISLEDTLDTRKLIPTLLIQPFVENAINHGILPSERTGRVEIIFRTIKNGIQCTISDNGVGREASRALNRDKDPTQGSYGNLLIKDLIKVFDKYEEMKINITYQDRHAPNAGTDVIIDITYIQPKTDTINTRN